MSDPFVVINQGKLKGFVDEDYKGGKFLSFCGIPYAKAPLGDLRFKAPVPAEPWTGIFDATKEGNVCVQYDEILTKKVLGSEDCLFLNVFTRKINAKTPVMVFIHGGGFTKGAGNSLIYGPQFLMTSDIVLVTFNYRIGILGFLSFEDTSLNVSCNVGMKDMVLALKWVQSNINKFGGDPNNVTIFGESAGGASVHYLMLSPMAKGIFHKAIIQSGSIFNPWALGTHFNEQAWKKAGIQETSPEKVLTYLQQLSAEKLHEVYEKIEDNLNPNSKRYFAPVIESTTKDAFLAEDPLELIKSGNYNQVPLIIGYTSNEGMLIEMNKSDPKNDFLTNIEASIPHFLNLPKEGKNSQVITEKIKKFYLKNKDISEADIEDVYKLSTDTLFLCGIIGAVKNHVHTGKYSIYMYKMTVESSLNFLKNFLKIEKPGVCHGDDIGYLFSASLSPIKIQLNSPEDLYIQRFVKLWTNFAYYGNPTPNSQDELLEVVWKPVEKSCLHFLELGKKLKMDKSPEEERMKFWKEFFNNNKQLSNFL